MFLKKENSLNEENIELKKQIKYLQPLLTPNQQNIYQEQQKLVSITHQLNNITIEHNEKINSYNKMVNDYNKLSNHIAQSNDYINQLNEYINQLNNHRNQLTNQIQEKEKQLIWLNEELSLQEFGLYYPIYDFESSELYKQHIEQIRNSQKQMILQDFAVFYSKSFLLNGSVKEGGKMINDNVKQILRTFNEECETIIDKVKFNNIEKIKERIVKSSEILNKLNERMSIKLNPQYVNLKIEELHLVYEYQLKKQKEKEIEKQRREEQKEQQKVQKELEEKRKLSEKENMHYANALKEIEERTSKCIDDFEKTILLEKQKELTTKVEEITKELETLDYRIANQLAGYVYIISNIGAFGENIYKIGMTRRLEPQERIDELSNASVPFPYDVHAMIFSNDAPTLENMLHKQFEEYKVNRVNDRKEFFNVSLEEIENFIKTNYDNTIEIKKTPMAEQYRETKKIKETLK